MKYLKTINESSDKFSNRYDREIIEGFIEELSEIGFHASLKISCSSNSKDQKFRGISCVNFEQLYSNIEKSKYNWNQFNINYNIKFGTSSQNTLKEIKIEVIDNIKDCVDSLKGRMKEFSDLSIDHVNIQYSTVYSESRTSGSANNFGIVTNEVMNNLIGRIGIFKSSGKSYKEVEKEWIDNYFKEMDNQKS